MLPGKKELLLDSGLLLASKTMCLSNKNILLLNRRIFQIENSLILQSKQRLQIGKNILWASCKRTVPRLRQAAVKQTGSAVRGEFFAGRLQEIGAESAAVAELFGHDAAASFAVQPECRNNLFCSCKNNANLHGSGKKQRKNTDDQAEAPLDREEKQDNSG